MRTGARIARLAALLSIALVVVPVSAQRRDDALDLARLCAHEGGFDVSAGECAAIHAVVTARCRRCTVALATRTVSPRVFRARNDSRGYFSDLDRRGSEPLGWPHAGLWPVYRAAWLSLIDVADAIVRGEVEHGCAGDLEAWGGPCDDARAERLRLVRVECPAHYGNRFYTYPSRRQVD